jgi:hypothetical protein
MVYVFFTDKQQSTLFQISESTYFFIHFQFPLVDYAFYAEILTYIVEKYAAAQFKRLFVWIQHQR